MNVAEAVGAALAGLGVGRVFGVVGSGNFHVTNALAAAGVPVVTARHEGGAATMADAYARMSGRVSVLSVHQGCGLTNAMTGIAEAAKSRTPMIVLAAASDNPLSNFTVDQRALARAVTAVPMRIDEPVTALPTLAAAYRTARDGRRTVLLDLPLAVQGSELPSGAPGVGPDQGAPSSAPPEPEQLNALAEALHGASRPVFIAGRGARGEGCRAALEDLAERCGALLATSAVAKGMFHDSPWSLDISGGFATPLAARLIQEADLVVGWGCALNMWTTRHGTLVGPGATVAQVDLDSEAIGRHREVHLGVTGGALETAREAARLLPGPAREGYRRAQVRERIAAEGQWRQVPFADNSTGELVDPRALSIALDSILPAERVLSIDSGNFMGYPSMFLSVPDERGFCFTQAFQSIGLGLASAIGAALAQPGRLPVAALGDGGALMGAVELETVARLGLPMVVVVYNDAAYGAEVHHFAPDGHDTSTVEFPPTDIAAIGRGYGFTAVTVRDVRDLAGVRDWVAGGRHTPLLIDAKITPGPSWWLEEAMRGH